MELLRTAMRATCHQGEGSLQCPPFNLSILPGYNGGNCQVDARFQPRLSSGSVFPAKMSGQGVRTHPPMVLLVMTQEIKLSAFFKDSKLTFLLV